MIALRIHTEEKDWTVPLDQGPKWRIGRGEECEIQVPDRRISSEHAELTAHGSKLLLNIIKGRRPAEIDGLAVASATLASGSTFTLGHSHFTVIAERDGMNLFDAGTVLAGSFPQPVAPTGESPQIPAIPSLVPPVQKTTPSSSMRLMAQLLALTKSSSDKHSLADAVLEFACSRLMATRGVLARVEDSQRLEVIASRGVPADADVKSLISTTVLKQIIDERQAVVIGNTEHSGTKLAL